jgi:DNA-binding LacI/PurR family transcriptional regulator
VSLSKEEIYCSLLKRIESGEFKVGRKMPTERKLAEEFKAPQWRVHLAISELEDNGFVERRRAAGTFVRKDISLDNVSRKKNKTSNKVVVSVSRDFYYQKENYHDIIGDLEHELEGRQCEVVYSVFPQNREELEAFLGGSADNAKALILFPEYKEWGVMHLCRDILARYLGNIFYFNRGKGPDDLLPFNSISLNFYASGFMAGAYVLDRGIKNMAYFSRDISSYWGSQRHSGFKGASGTDTLEHPLFVNTQIEKLYDPLADYIKSCDSAPAIVCANDQLASCVSSQMRLEGLKNGNDFILIGFDNHPKYRMEKIVSIGWPLDKLGGMIADSVFRMDDDSFHDHRVNKSSVLPLLFDRPNIEEYEK